MVNKIEYDYSFPKIQKKTKNRIQNKIKSETFKTIITLVSTYRCQYQKKRTLLTFLK